MNEVIEKLKVRTLSELDTLISQLEEKKEQAKGTETMVYSRVVGYYQPVSNWNKGKRREFDERKTFDLELSLNRV